MLIEAGSRRLLEIMPDEPAAEDPASLNPAVLIRRVKALASAGNGPKEIAQRLGVDLMLVRGVLNGKVA